MRKIIKFLFYFLMVLGLACLFGWLVVQQDLKLWVGVAVFCALIGTWLAMIFLRSYLARRRMREFVERVVKQEPPTYATSTATKIDTLKELQKNWQKSIKLVSLSKINKVPWYLVLGAEGSGKTSAIKGARLNTALSSATKGIGISATENCDWWFLEKSIILDTAGRYVVPVDVERDNQEWIEFLKLLGKYNRKRNPLNGIVIAISAQRLLTNDAMALRDEGQNLRKRINNLEQVCWAKIPVYIMITQMDHVFGFNETFQSLGEEELDQAAGYINNGQQDWQDVLGCFLSATAQKLCEIRSRLIVELPMCNEPGQILFPQEFQSLKVGLSEYVKAIFEQNPYQVQPLCRGIYFSSAQQADSSQSTILKEHGAYLRVSNGANVNGRRGLFLRDFFDKVLYLDKDIVQAANGFLKWRYIFSSVGLLPILFFLAAGVSLQTASYIHNRNIINQFLTEFKKPPVMTNDIATNLVLLETLQVRIKQLEKANNAWFLPTLGLNNGQVLVSRLKVQYANLYEQGFINRINQLMYLKINQIGEGSSTAEISLYIEFLMARINLLKLYLNNDGVKDSVVTQAAARKLAVVFSLIMRQLYPDVPQTIADTAYDSHVSYLEWNENKALQSISLRTMLKTVRDLLTKYPNWQIIKKQVVGSNVRLDSFWGGNSANYSEVPGKPLLISGMYTKSGMVEIKNFLNLMKEAGLTSGDDDPQVKQFWQQYRVEYFSAWQGFAQNFKRGEDFFKSDDEKKNLAARMVSESNPYLQFLATAAIELKPDEHLDNPPGWVRLILELDDIQRNAKSALNTVNLQQRILTSVGKVVPGKAEATAYLDHQIQATSLFNAYWSALAQSYPDLFSDDSYAHYVGQVFAEYNGTSDQKSAISTAIVKFNQLQKLFTPSDASAELVWQLEGGPLNYLLNYLMGKASCALESKWQGDVLGKIAEVPGDKVFQPLLDKSNGLLWKYVNDTLAPFLTPGKWGYSSKVIYENTLFMQRINFDPKFIKFLNSAQPAISNYQDQYTVNIAAVPIAVNSQATVKPYGVVISLQCAEGEQTLKNYNYPSSMRFNWSPDKCGTTTLSILFPNLTLTKTYSGTMGFPQFLADFKTGAHQFKSTDFAEADTLENSYDIEWIKITYKLDQSMPSMTVMKNLSANIPQKVTGCNY